MSPLPRPDDSEDGFMLPPSIEEADYDYNPIATPTLSLSPEPSHPPRLRLNTDVPLPLFSRLNARRTLSSDKVYFTQDAEESLSPLSIPIDRKRRFLWAQLDEAIDEMRDKKSRRTSYQESIGPVPNHSPVTSDASDSVGFELNLFHRAAQKVAVLTKDDFDDDADIVFKQILAVMDSDDTYDWTFSFSPTEKRQDSGTSRTYSSLSRVKSNDKNTEGQAGGDWACVSNSSTSLL
jgi:hypothetical protein